MAHAARKAKKKVNHNSVVLREDGESHQLLFIIFSQILKKKKKYLYISIEICLIYVRYLHVLAVNTLC